MPPADPVVVRVAPGFVVQIEIGPAEVRSASDGTFLLDGGAMFGIVPRTLWERTDPPDGEGRIRLAVRPMLVRVDDRVIVVDTGIGSSFSARDTARYGIDHSSADLIRSLASLGVAREDVTDVVLTHLHFDHAGGTYSVDAHGHRTLTFPNATHHLQRRNLEHALRPTLRDRGSYLEDRFAALIGSEQLVLLDGPAEIAAGVDTVIVEGHTVGQQLVRVRDPRPGGVWLLYMADIIPTSSHLSSAFVMGYDLLPDVTAREKERIVSRAAREGGTLFFEHDPRMAGCTVRFDERGRPVVDRPIAEC